MAEDLCTELTQDLSKFSSTVSNDIPTLTINSKDLREHEGTEENSKMKRKGAIRKRNNSSSKIRNESIAINLDCVDDVTEEPIESMSNLGNPKIDQGTYVLICCNLLDAKVGISKVFVLLLSTYFLRIHILK